MKSLKLGKMPSTEQPLDGLTFFWLTWWWTPFNFSFSSLKGVWRLFTILIDLYVFNWRPHASLSVLLLLLLLTLLFIIVVIASVVIIIIYFITIAVVSFIIIIVSLLFYCVAFQLACIFLVNACWRDNFRFYHHVVIHHSFITDYLSEYFRWIPL